MQSTANNILDNENTPLFSNDEIIFPDETVERPFTRYGYTVSGMKFLVPEKTASEILQNQNIFMLPNSPTWIEGLINIRGNIVPVMNMDKVLNKATKEKPENILVFDKADNNTSAIALLISDLPISLEHNDSHSTINNYPELLHDYISSGFNQNGTDWVEFNPQKLFKNMAGKVDI